MVSIIYYFFYISSEQNENFFTFLYQKTHTILNCMSFVVLIFLYKFLHIFYFINFSIINLFILQHFLSILYTLYILIISYNHTFADFFVVKITSLLILYISRVNSPLYQLSSCYVSILLYQYKTINFFFNAFYGIILLPTQALHYVI